MESQTMFLLADGGPILGGVVSSMSGEILPRLNPRFRELSQTLYESSEKERKIRTELLKQKFKAGAYNPSSLALARSLMTPAAPPSQSHWQGESSMKQSTHESGGKKP